MHGKLVDAGEYHVRGLFRKDLDLRYEFSVYSPGNPPWHTADRTGGWLADHTPQAAVLSLPNGSPHGKQPQMLLGSPIAEDGYSLAWVDLGGNKLYSGKASGWRVAYALACDAGPNPREGCACLFRFPLPGNPGLRPPGRGHGLQLRDRTSSKAAEWLPFPVRRSLATRRGYMPKRGLRVGTFKGVGVGLDLAVYDHVVAVSLPESSQILFVDAAAPPATSSKRKQKPAGRIVGKASVPHPTGLMADAQGRLYVLSDKKLKRLDVRLEIRGAKERNGPGRQRAGRSPPLTTDAKGNLVCQRLGSKPPGQGFFCGGQVSTGNRQAGRAASGAL